MSKKGYLIALIGADGTGKSSIAQALKETAEKRFGSSSVIYMGSSNQLLITSKIILKLSSLNKQMRSRGRHIKQSSDEPDRGLIGIIKELTFLHYIFELFARYFFWVYPRIKKGDIVICDRYIYDFLIIKRRLNNYSWFRNSLISIIPVPDLLGYLYNEPDIIIKRKQDNSVEETMRQNKAFLSLEHRVRSFKKIRTDGRIKDIAEGILSDLNNAYH